MSWTTIAKPTGTNYTNLNPVGKEQYDQASITYDDAGIFYDGVNYAAWTDILKPVGSFVLRVGMATGLIMPPTYSEEYGGDSWTKINKPS